METKLKLTPQAKAALDLCIQVAHAAKCPPDLIEKFISHLHVPLPWQWSFHKAARDADLPDGPTEIAVGGARGGGKSHAVLAQAGLDDCQRVNNLKCLFLRQTGVAAQESFDDLIQKCLKGHCSYKKSGNKIIFENTGSRILLGGFQDERDIDKYIGIEYDLIIIEEQNQITEDKFIKLLGSLRTSKTNWRPRIYTSFNPGDIGHVFIKNRYVEPFRAKKETTTRFFPSTYKDNPHLNLEYTQYLLNLVGDLGRMWRDGDFDIFAGQAFSEFSRLLHVIRPVQPSLVHSHHLSFDWGFSASKPHAFAAYLHAHIQDKTPDGQNFNRIITYKEWCGNMKRPDEWAEKIYNDCVEMKVLPENGVADSSMFNPTSDYGEAISDLFMNKWKELNGKKSWVRLIKGTKDRVGRKAATHNWLALAPGGLPYWMITENCYWLAKTIPELITDKNRVEDVDTEGPDDPYDSATYFLYVVKPIRSGRVGPINYGQGARPYRPQYNEKGEQLAFSPEDFANALKE